MLQINFANRNRLNSDREQLSSQPGKSDREKILLDVWLITGVVTLYGLAIGLSLNATPQVCLELKLTSDQLGLIATGIPIGYTLTCLAAGRILGRIRGKYVLIAGVCLATLSLLTMAGARTPSVCVLAQIGCGVAGGLFWPFASAWLMDFQSPQISRARLLRHYNMAWTSGTAIGMFSSGVLFERGWIFQILYLAASVAGLALFIALWPRSTPSHTETVESGIPIATSPRIAGALLVAAISVNWVSLGTRSTLWNNYAELNHLYSFGAERMGLISSLSLVGQILAFGFGALYEPWLGLRRVYVFIAVALAAVNLAFAYSSSLPILLAAALLLGFVMALTFQTGMMAAIRFFPSARGGTTFHEAMIGIGTMTPLLAGAVVANLKGRGFDPMVALRAPYLGLAVLSCLFLLLQLSLLGRGSTQKALFHAASTTPVNSEA